MDMTSLRAHIDNFAREVDTSVVDHIRQFADWLDVRLADEAKAKEYSDWLTAHGYTVTKQ